MVERLQEIWDYRDMIGGLVKRELRGRYKGSIAGFLWNYINPLCQILVYILVFGVIFPSSLERFYVYLIVGLMPWNMFSATIVQASGCIFAQADMVKKIYFPREVLVIATTTSQLVNFLISYLVAFAIIIVTGAGINLQLILLYLPLTIIIEYLLALGISLVLAAVDVYFRDMEYITGVITMIWVWLTPIMYSIQGVPEKLAFWLRLNPLTHIIGAYQNILYYKTAPDIKALGLMGIMAIAILIIGEYIFIHLEKHFAEEL